MTPSQPEVWLRGALPGIPPLLQPVAHALLQAREEVDALMADFPEDCLWTRPNGVASAGFHLQHLTGVLERLFTYARGQPLNQDQLAHLEAEGTPGPGLESYALVAAFRTQVDAAVSELCSVHEDVLTEARAVGRNRLPSTVLGLYVHAAEHIQRHVGQLSVTVRIQRI